MYKKILIALGAIVIFSTMAFAQTDQSVTLKPGFNFLSFTSDISLTAAQLKTLNSAISDIYLYSANAGGFLSFSEGTLTNLSKGKGYIVKIEGAADISITIPGNTISKIGDIGLKSGFNLVGFSKAMSNMTFTQLMNAYTAIKGIYKWSPNAGGFIQVVRDDSGLLVQIDGVDPSFKAGESYFFNVVNDTTINYDENSIKLGENSVIFAMGAASFKSNDTIPVEFSATGANVSPELHWYGAPAGTICYALVCEDPTNDAANPCLHWAIYNIPASFTGLDKGIPQGDSVSAYGAALKQLETYGGKKGYDGPCPPAGEAHTYNFKLYALGAMPDTVSGIAGLRSFISANKLGETVISGKFYIALPVITDKYFKMKLTPSAIQAAPSMQTAAVTGQSVTFDPAKHSIKVYDQLSGTLYPADGDPSNPSSYISQIKLNDTPRIIVLEIIEKATGNVIARNVVGKCPLLSEMPANVNALEMQNPPIDIKTTVTSMAAFEKLGSSVPAFPPFDYQAMTPDANGIIVKAMQASDTTSFTAELQKKIGGMPVVESLASVKNGIARATNGVAAIRNSAAQIPVNIPEPYASQNLAMKNGLLESAAMIENCMAGLKAAINLVPSSSVPNPAAATELLKSYVKLSNEIPKIKEKFTSLGMTMPTNEFDNVPEYIDIPNGAGTVRIDKTTNPDLISTYISAIPVWGSAPSDK